MNQQRETISILTEIPDDLHHHTHAFLEQNPDWDWDRITTVAIAKFLMESTSTKAQVEGRSLPHIYMNHLFNH